MLRIRLARCASSMRNSAGIYHLQEDLRRQLFPRSAGRASSASELAQNKQLERISLTHLAKNGLLNQETKEPPEIKIELPRLLGNSLDEHFQRIGRAMCSPYLDLCSQFLNARPREFKPGDSEICLKSGWTRYAPDQPPTRVPHPHEAAIVFDVETLPRQTEFAVMATALSDRAWYVWLSPWLLGETENSRQLVPLGRHEQVVIGHYVGFDRKRVLEEYSLRESKKWFMDTMSFHIAVNGMCNQQRPTYMEYQSLLKKGELRRAHALTSKEPWLLSTSKNSLEECVRFHLSQTIDKSDREYFLETVREDFTPELIRNLVRYCASDSYYTKLLFDVVYPKFLARNPHPVSIGSLRPLSQLFLPTTDEWSEYVDTCDSYFEDMQGMINTSLEKLAVEAVDSADASKIAMDPWLSQLDWTVKPVRYTKGTSSEPPRPFKNQSMPGKPQWYKDVFVKGAMKLSTRMRTSVLLLRLSFDGYPLVWFDSFGWCFYAPKERRRYYLDRNYTAVTNSGKDGVSIAKDGMSLIKLPHPDGAEGRCTNPFAKFYMPYFESKQLNSENALAANALATNAECTYWLSARQRIQSQMPVYYRDLKRLDGNVKFADVAGDVQQDESTNAGLILPRVAVTGTITRRAVEDTWLTASNAKKNRLGSELKSKVQAPLGYSIVGADVDSEELWIASVVGDSFFNIHGGTALGWMTLEGSKNAGTDLHSKSAKILGISRNEAKIFNYGRIYGAGRASAVRNLRMFNPSMTLEEAENKAADLYNATKGIKSNSSNFALPQFYSGGTESAVYNQLELLASQKVQRTPILGSEITEALQNANLRRSGLLRTRVNWTIQSSGVDYLHLLIASMFYLTQVYNLKARLMLTVHDEVRYLVKDEDKYRAALALQIANLWTRAIFCEQLGFDNIPANVAFFSMLDIDKVLRKEVSDDCVTPTQPIPLNSGEALSIVDLLKKCSALGNPASEIARKFESQLAVPREPYVKGIKIPYRLKYALAQTLPHKDAAKIENAITKKVKAGKTFHVPSRFPVLVRSNRNQFKAV